MTRMSASAAIPAGVASPRYDRASVGSGIVHLGVGAFHKAHQAVCTDDALAASGGNWTITGVSLRSPDVADAMNPQDGLYTLLVRGAGGVAARVVGSITSVLVAPREPKNVLEAMASPETKIVSLTITEKGYGLDPKTGGLDRNHASVASDLSEPDCPYGAVGYIVEALRLRQARGLPGFTALCCDNLPSNGHVLKRLVMEFAGLARPELVSYIEANVSFPSTMVDRITPASTDRTFADAVRFTGHEDLAAVETEPFTQWVIEDDFVAGRPDWAAGGAIFAADVAPFEKMKLRMLNGTHSMLAYSGFIAGRAYVRDVMADEAHARLVRRHMAAAAQVLDPIAGISLERYADELAARFANPEIEHKTWQIAMDGTQKLPQRLIEPAMVALRSGTPLDAYAFAVAAWMRYCLGETEAGERYALRDPREGEIGTLIANGGRDAETIVDRLLALPGLFPGELSSSPQWRQAVSSRLQTMLARSMREAIQEEAATVS